MPVFEKDGPGVSPSPFDPPPPSVLLNDLKSRIDADAYVVDPVLVADALLRRGATVLGVPVIPSGARNPAAPPGPQRPAG
jgi:hypothetical protein